MNKLALLFEDVARRGQTHLVSASTISGSIAVYPDFRLNLILKHAISEWQTWAYCKKKIVRKS